MPRSIYRFILQHSWRGQLVLILLTVLSLPLTYYGLDLPKQIINKGIEGEGRPETFLGHEVSQIDYLLILCVIFLVVVIANGGFKYVINVYKGVLSERLLRRLRYTLYHRILRFPMPQFKRTSQGELIAMTTGETEPLGAFIGDSIAEPALQGGILLTYLFFIFNQDPFLGAAAIALYPVQMVVIPRIQKRVNKLSRERVQTVRGMADRIGEGVSGITEIHTHGTARYELADIAARLSRIYDIRFEIYKRKYFIKFLNSFLSSVTPFFFYAIGGYFVIQGSLSIGALVAVLAAYKDLNPPWKALLKYYQTKEDMQVKYGQIVERFSVPDMRDESLIASEAEAEPDFDQPITLTRVSLTEDGVVKALDGVSLTLPPREHVAVLGPAGGGKNAIADLLGRLVLPTHGQIRLGETDYARLPDTTLGRHLGYVGATGHIFTGTVFDNMAYSLKQRPVDNAALAGTDAADKRRRSAELSGNTVDDVEAQWIDVGLIGLSSIGALRQRMIEVLGAVGLERDVYGLGLRSRIDARANPELAQRFVEARLDLRQRLEDQGITDLVEPFDPERYNQNASVAENLLFGTPLTETFATGNLAGNAEVVAALRAEGIHESLVEVGRKLAETMVELFADLPPDHEFFERFSFIGADDLPDYRALLARVSEQSVGQMAKPDQQRLLSLAFKLIPARHRLDLVREDMQARIVAARHRFARELSADSRAEIAFFDPRSYNDAATLEDNILFGKLVHGAAQARERVGELIEAVLGDRGIRHHVVDVGLDYEVGIAGGRLSFAQRQKLAIARALLKAPDILILNEATAAIDAADDAIVRESVMTLMQGGRVVWVLGNRQSVAGFDRVVELDGGTVVGDRPAARDEGAEPAKSTPDGASGETAR